MIKNIGSNIILWWSLFTKLDRAASLVNDPPSGNVNLSPNCPVYLIIDYSQTIKVFVLFS